MRRRSEWTGRKLTALAVLGLSIVTTSPGSSVAYPRPSEISIVVSSHQSNQMREAEIANHAVISADGRFVAYTSSISDLVPNDLNQVPDVFVTDMKSGDNELVSQSTDGVAAEPCLGFDGELRPEFGSSGASISTNGRYVVFESCSATLVPGDTNLVADVFIRDRKKATTTVVSIAPDGSLMGGTTSSSSAGPAESVSANGRYVVFMDAPRPGKAGAFLMPDAEGENVYLRDTRSGTTEVLSITPDGENGDGSSGSPRISADGRFVAFGTDAPNLTEHGPGQRSLLLRDLQKGQNLTVHIEGPYGNPSNWSINSDGRFVVFDSIVSDIVPNDDNQSRDVFVFDRLTGRKERVNVSSSGEEPSDDRPPFAGVSHVTISYDGRFVAFTGWQTGLVDDDTNGNTADVYLHDRAMGATYLVSRHQDGTQSGSNVPVTGGAPQPWYPMTVGRFTVFDFPDPLIPEDTNGAKDLYVRDIGDVLGVSESDRARAFGACLGDRPCDDIFIVGDALSDVGPLIADTGADVVQAHVAVRRPTNDVYFKLDLETLPRVVNPALMFGFEFSVDGVSYEVRAHQRGHESVFGLFECVEKRCTHVGELRGGIGTVGHSVVLTVPMADIGLGEDGSLEDVQGFTALGTYFADHLKILDTLEVPTTN